MGSPITNMLLGQAAPVQKDVSQMTPEELSAYVAALQRENPAPEPTPGAATMPVAPPPRPAPAQQPGMLERILGALGLAPSTASLAGPQPTPAPLTPEQLAERNRRLAGGQ